MFIIVHFVSNDKVTHIIDTNNFEPALKKDVEEKVKQNPYLNFPDKYFTELQKGTITNPIKFPTMIDGNTTVYID
jgi:hypothetical protein